MRFRRFLSLQLLLRGSVHHINQSSLGRSNEMSTSRAIGRKRVQTKQKPNVEKKDDAEKRKKTNKKRRGGSQRFQTIKVRWDSAIKSEYDLADVVVPSGRVPTASILLPMQV
ncbi:hypothetical protein DFJ73DRAFT_812785 [Zopfochytrium polystomum]|nr:hypothetical protein DFJ73DRAFT_812785 [Zopfochytrium polystomum]